MDDVDVSDHYEVTTADETPSLLTVILDTNPRAWAALDDRLPLLRAVAHLLVFINAHLAFSNANQVAIVAAHVNRARWLYPSPPSPSDTALAEDGADDVVMEDAAPPPAPSSANKYPQSARIESTVFSSVRRLLDETTPADVDATTTQLSGALTLALCYINKAARSLRASNAHPTEQDRPDAAAPATIKGRILILSVSDSDPAQYIPIMNAVFAAAHAQVAIDTLALIGQPTYLQQACFNTDGIFLAASSPEALLTYLMLGFVADNEARKSLIVPTSDKTDFRAACFCHGKVVDMGFVCSVCLSIFCEVPEDAVCLTCGTQLALGSYGSKPAVIPRKKKRKKVVNGNVKEGSSSAAGTPRP